ncbi:MAG: hypothetical protein MR038_03765 [Oscillospiraceae bacterium]|nr:hypothetical protein [Oscillospiraceae bacterium]
MKMISNDLRSSCRAMLLGAYQEGGGGTYRNAVFHDIVDNSDTLLTVPVDDHYRITVNFWVTDRTDVYGSYMNTFFGMIFENENEGYGTRVNWLSKKAYIVFIIWKDNNAVFAKVDGQTSLYNDEYNLAEVRESNDTPRPYTFYAYPSRINSYVKGSAVLANAVSGFEWEFSGDDGQKWFDDQYNGLYLLNSSGNTVGLSVNYTVKTVSYSCEYPKCEWTDPDTGTTSTIDDKTAVPTVKVTNASTAVKNMSSGSELHFCPNSYGTFSDHMSSTELLYAYNKFIEAVCAANGFRSHIPQLFLPETEE